MGRRKEESEEEEVSDLADAFWELLVVFCFFLFMFMFLFFINYYFVLDFLVGGIAYL